MEDVMLKDILEKHRLWLLGDKNGVKADLREVDFSGADLSLANLRGVDLSYANLSLANLRGADLREANLSYADLSGADLRGAKLREVYFSEANLSFANLRGADLREANLREANLRGADLREAKLSYADLRGVTFSEANLRGANLNYSCLPLWCGSLRAHFDDRQLKQLAYHLVRAGLQSKNASDATKRELVKLIDFANGFHEVGECGEIRVGRIENLKGL